jgi:hypothetical protein
MNGTGSEVLRVPMEPILIVVTGVKSVKLSLILTYCSESRIL